MAGIKHRELHLRQWRRAGARTLKLGFRSLFQKMPVGLYYLSSQGAILDANIALLDMLGFPDKAALLRLNIADLYVDPSRQKMQPSDTIANEVVYNHGVAFRRADGSILRADDYRRAVRTTKGEVLGFEGCVININGRNVAEGALKEAELRYQTLVEQMPDAAIYMDAVDPTVSTFYVSPQIQRMLGYSPEEWQRNPRSWRERIHPDDRERVLAAEAHHKTTGEPFSQEYRLLARDGRTVWIRDESVMLLDNAGRPRFSHGIMIDITNRKQAEEGLARQMAQLNALYEVSREVVAGRDPETVYRAAHDAAKQILPIDSFIITLLDESGQEARDVYLFDHGQCWPNEHSPLSERGMMAHVIRTREPLLIEDDLDGTSEALGSLMFGDPQDESETRSLLVVPLLIKDRPIGIMSAQHYAPRMYSAEDVQNLMTLANQVAIAIEQARLVKSYQLRNAALDAAANAILITDRQGRIEWANPAFARLSGYTLEEAIGRPPGDLVKSGRQDRAFYEQMWETILSGEVWHGQLTNRRKDGSLYIEEMTITPVGDEKSGSGQFIAIKQDITERRAAEIALRESEAKYRTVVEQATDGIAIIQKGIVKYANPRLAALRGEPLADILGKRFSLFAAPAERGKVLAMYRRRSASQETPPTYETVLLKKDNIPVTVELTPTPITFLGASADIVIVRDISERQLAEKLLQQQLREMVALNRVSSGAVKATDLDDFIRTATLSVQEALHPDNCGVLLLDREEQRWRPHSSYQGTGPEHLTRDYPVSEGIVGKVMTSEKMVRVPDVSREPFYREAMPGIQSEICVPIMVDRNVFGCLNAESKEADAFTEHDEHLLRTIADGMSLAIEKIRLLNLEQERRQEAELLYATTHDLVMDHDLSTLLHTIVGRASALLKAAGGSIYMCEPETRQVRCLITSGFPRDFAGTVLKYGEGAAGMVALTGEPLIIEDYRVWEKRAPVFEAEQPFISVMSVPIHWQDRTIGVIGVAETSQRRNFTEEDLRMVTLFANQAAIAIENARLFEEERHRRQEAAAITEVGRDISASLQLDVVLERITTYAKRLLHAETSAVYLADPAASTLQAVVVLGSETAVIKAHRIQIGQGILGSIAARRKGEIINNTPEDPRAIVLEGDLESSTEHIMGVPIVSKDQLISLIAVWRSGEGQEFKPSDLDFLNSLAQQVGVAIENARLFEETQKRLREMEGVAQVSAVLSHTLELDPLLQEILQAAIHAMPPAQRGSILLADEQSNLHLRAVWGYTDSAVPAYSVSPNGGLAAASYRERRGILAPNLLENAGSLFQQDSQGIQMGGSALAVPLVVKDRAIGVIALDTPLFVHAFDERDLDLLQSMAVSTALAIENARLFENTRRRLLEIQAVYTVSSALRSARTIGEALPIILDQLMEIFAAGGATLEMVDPATGEIVTELASGVWARVTGLRGPSGEGISGQVVATGQPYISMDVVADAKAYRPDLFAGLNAVACVPVIALHQPIGALWVGRQTRITEDEVSLLATIGEMVGNSLHRMRLNEQTERRADQLASLRTIDQAITASLDLRLTLNILLDQTISHLKVHAADILLFNPATHDLESSAWRGFYTGSVTRFPQQLRAGLGRRVALEKRAVYISNLAQAVDTLEARMLMRNEGFVAYYGIPLIAKDQLVGILECFQRLPLNPDADWTSFLEALAGQAAIAIEKARLLDDLQTSNQELRDAYDTTLEGWARALELRDEETKNHSRRVTRLALKLAREFGISDTGLMHMRRGVLLHDIGKMGVPDEILRKKGPLSEDETAEMRRHPQYAYDLLYPIAYLRPAVDIPYCHHERWDGTGYPRGLKGEQIPLAARIFAVVDVWDALLYDRPYRKAHAWDDALAYISQHSGSHFDPAVVQKFLALINSAEDDDAQDADF